MRKGYRLFRGLYPVSALLCSRTEPGVRVLPTRHAPAPPTWKSFCFSATRFWKRFRAVELKERTSAWETWRGGSRWVLETHARVSPKGMAVGGGRRGGALRGPDTRTALSLACVSKAKSGLPVRGREGVLPTKAQQGSRAYRVWLRGFPVA